MTDFILPRPKRSRTRKATPVKKFPFYVRLQNRAGWQRIFHVTTAGTGQAAREALRLVRVSPVDIKAGPWKVWGVFETPQEGATAPADPQATTPAAAPAKAPRSRKSTIPAIL